MKPISHVVSQFTWTAVKEITKDHPVYYGTPGQTFRMTSYDMWEWNIFKLKWVRLSNTACGFGTKEDADASAIRRSNEIQAMFDANRNTPTPL